MILKRIRASLLFKATLAVLAVTLVAGLLALAPGPAETARQGARTAVVLRMAVLCLTAALGLTLAYTVQRSIIRAIASLSDRLRRLEAETGALLSSPPGHEQDEIGRLEWDVNALAERLVRALTHERELAALLELEQRKVQAILQRVGTGVFVADGNGALEAWTPAFLRMLGLEQAPPARGDSVPALFGESAVQVEEGLARCRAGGAQVMAAVRVRLPEGLGQRWLQLCLEPVGPGLIQGLLEQVTSFQDVPEPERKLALRDPLTGVLSRPSAEQALTERLAKNRTGLVLMLVNLDRFHQVNADYGREAGDEVLRQVVLRIAAHLRRSDLLARLGGDEFLLILDTLADEKLAVEIAQKIIKAIGGPITLPGSVATRVGASVGIVLHDSAQTPSRLTLLQRADQAVSQAKLAGRNCARVFHQGL